MHQVGPEEAKGIIEKARKPAKETRVKDYMNSASMGSILTGGSNVIGEVEPKGIQKGYGVKANRDVWKPKITYNEFDSYRRDHF